MVDVYATHDLRPLTPRSITDSQTLRGELATIAETGLATEVRENHFSTRCVSAPVHVYSKAVAAVSLIMPASASWDASAVPLLRETSVNITRALARSGLKSLLGGTITRAPDHARRVAHAV